ncbi:DUF4145 domain-containing protein [Mesorhizobium loti]|uniref:DUF4145 domain-containing protein n=1 Tax=Rhizobium loti TaxID=381 RepID=UPI001267946F|nr:DUF4145 domain-containing protein [Mesorhizobium loti]
MANVRYFWDEYFMQEHLPPWQCPTCGRGNLALDKESLRIGYSADVIAERDNPDWEPEWERGRFSCLLVCDQPKCGDIVSMIGETVTNEFRSDDDSEQFIAESLVPKSMIPGAPLMNIPPATPSAAQNAIKQSFSAFWGDRGSAANRLRISVERILDSEGIPATTEKGAFITLAARIDLFGEKSPEYKDTLTALRVVGNLGSHDGDVTREALLDAYEVYEDWLKNYVGKHGEKMKGLVKKLTDTKGKYTV